MTKGYTMNYDETTVYTVRLHVIRWDNKMGVKLNSRRDSISFPNKAGAANSAYAKFTELVGEWQAELAETETVSISVNIEMLVEDVCDGTKISLVYWSDER